MTHELDLVAMTIDHIDADGERHDLNAHGEPIGTMRELADFICELHAQCAYDAETRNELLEDLPLGQVIADLVGDFGSQAKMASELGLSGQSRISEYVRGKRTPSVSVVLLAIQSAR